MSKHILTILCAFLPIGAAMAQRPQIPAPPPFHDPTPMPTWQDPPQHGPVCYYAGKEYSLGAVLDGKACVQDFDTTRPEWRDEHVH